VARRYAKFAFGTPITLEKQLGSQACDTILSSEERRDIMQRAFVVLLLSGLCAPAFAGPDWVERGDAGSFVNTAQITTGIGGIRSLTGNLNAGSRSAPDLEDVYIIRIDDPSTFSITLNTVDFTPALYCST
jgi:predicted nucleic acid-binding Zn ribbon protein